MMNVERLPIKNEIIQILQQQGIQTLYPPQAEALPRALNGENIVVAVPTAAGKSLVAYLPIIQEAFLHKKKSLYIVPLRALAREKWEDLQPFKKLGIKIGIATGDLDEKASYLAKNDIIVCTSEKADSLLRHQANWLNDIAVLVADEIHLINDISRGPTLEMIIARFRAMNPDIQIIALSATIKNAQEIARWLDSILIESKWRPVPLKEGIYHKNKIYYGIDDVKTVSASSPGKIAPLIIETIKEGGQALIFVNTRRATEKIGETLGGDIGSIIQHNKLEKISQTLRQAEGTIMGKKLIGCIKKGVAFHHAGLSEQQRRTVEQSFKAGDIKCIVATPTLAAGVNVPARRVIIRDLWRYASEFGGMAPIPVLEIKQMMGRAGRPGYDKEGEAILIAKNKGEIERLWTQYIIAEVEPIYSKLGSEPALRMHLLALIATNFVSNIEELYQFMAGTFFVYQSGSFPTEKIQEILQFLEENDFIAIDGNYLKATTFGRKTSDLYIDPLSALKLRTALESRIKPTIFSFLHAICTTPDMIGLYLRSKDSNWIMEKAEKEKFLFEDGFYSTLMNEWFLSEIKTASLLEDWINEATEDQIVMKYNVGPGDIHNKIETATWLIHAMRELARMFNFEVVSPLDKLLIRVKNGCKEELLNLIQLRDIGRVRSRALYKAGFKTINQLRDINIKTLSKIPTIGERVAKSIKEQLGETDGTQNNLL